MNLRCYTVVAGEPDVAFHAFTPPRPYKDHKNILFLLFWALGSTRNERLKEYYCPLGIGQVTKKLIKDNTKI